MAGLEQLRFTVRGTAPLLMHNERLANPFDEITRAIKAITAKKSRQTDVDHEDVQRLEWEGGLYFSHTHGPYIPGANWKKCLMEAATIYKGGAAVKRALTPMDAEIPLLYDGPRNVDALWEAKFVDVRGVKLNGRTKVQRTRPCFQQWGFATTMLINQNALSLDDLLQYTEQAGTTTGLGDYRPTYGRFTCQVDVL